jgi:hypothetical protein
MFLNLLIAEENWSSFIQKIIVKNLEKQDYQFNEDESYFM